LKENGETIRSYQQMEDENKEEFEQEEINESQIPRDVRESTESMSEFISNMDYVHIKAFHEIPQEEMRTKYRNEVFWYVYDEITQTIPAHKTNRVMEPAVYLFQEKADAETWMYIGSKSGTNQDHKLSVEGAEYLSLLEDEENTGEFRLMGISHAEAQNLFENYPEVKLTREFEGSRKLNRDSEEDD
jgi:hypothetical protein